jgi:methylthioribose-1-phosphate isomerase
VIGDSMAGHFLARGGVVAVVVGADRIARNGDVANKVGTFPLSCTARACGVPFYVAAPRSTVDLATADGAAIPIEERDPEEVRRVGGVEVVPRGVPARHVAFDVTPAANVTALITEAGVARAPYPDSIAALFPGAGSR